MKELLVCVDASIVVSLATPEIQSQKALDLWAKWMEEGINVAAPYLLRYEITSALRRKVIRGIMSNKDAKRSLEAILSLDIEFYDQSELSLRAFDITACLGYTAAYDAYYLALAEMLECEFWTADERLYNDAKDSYNVHWLR